MKKRFVVLLLALSFVVSVLSGCRARQAPAPDNVPPPPPEAGSTE